MTNFIVKSGTGSNRICFTNPATSGSGRISQKQIWYSPTQKWIFVNWDKTLYRPDALPVAQPTVT